jgi:hypothetical protein
VTVSSAGPQQTFVGSAEGGIRHEREGRPDSLYIGAAVIAAAGLNQFCEQGEL